MKVCDGNLVRTAAMFSIFQGHYYIKNFTVGTNAFFPPFIPLGEYIFRVIYYTKIKQEDHILWITKAYVDAISTGGIEEF